jgi:hypothetical protein
VCPVTGLAVFLIAIVSGVCWIRLFSAAWGVPIAFGLWRLDRRNRSLSKTQYVWHAAVGQFDALPTNLQIDAQWLSCLD